MLKIYVPYMLSYYLRSDGSESHVARHVCKILMSPQQYEIFTSNATHRWESRGLPLCACARPWRVHIFTSQRRTNQSLQFSKKSIAMRWRWDIIVGIFQRWAPKTAKSLPFSELWHIILVLTSPAPELYLFIFQDFIAYGHMIDGLKGFLCRLIMLWRYFTVVNFF